LAGRSASLHLGEPNRRELIGALALKPIGGLAVRSCRSSFSASLVARRDLSRQYAEFIDVPIPNEHLDRGQESSMLKTTAIIFVSGNRVPK